VIYPNSNGFVVAPIWLSVVFSSGFRVLSWSDYIMANTAGIPNSIEFGKLRPGFLLLGTITVVIDPGTQGDPLLKIQGSHTEFMGDSGEKCQPDDLVLLSRL